MQKRITIALLGIVLLVVVGVLTARRIKLQSPIVFLDEPQQVVVDNTSVSPLGSAESLTVIDQPNPELSIQDAVVQYGKKIEIDAECKATPRTIDVHIQQTLVVQNTFPAQRDIVIGNRLYRIPAGSYALAAFPKDGTYSIRCGEGVSGGVVLVTRD